MDYSVERVEKELTMRGKLARNKYTRKNLQQSKKQTNKQQHRMRNRTGSDTSTLFWMNVNTRKRWTEEGERWWYYDNNRQLTLIGQVAWWRPKFLILALRLPAKSEYFLSIEMAPFPIRNRNQLIDIYTYVYVGKRRTERQGLII